MDTVAILVHGHCGCTCVLSLVVLSVESVALLVVCEQFVLSADTVTVLDIVTVLVWTLWLYLCVDTVVYMCGLCGYICGVDSVALLVDNLTIHVYGMTVLVCVDKCGCT